MAIFDSLVSSLILQYSHHSEWEVLQPNLISKTFHQCFQSEEFAREYLRNLFSLNERQAIKLNEMIQCANQFFHSNNQEEEETNFKPNKKKRKHSKKNEKQNDKYSYWSILKMFVKLQNRNHVKQMNEHFTKYNSLAMEFPQIVPSPELAQWKSNKATNYLETIEKLVQIEQQQVALLERMKKFFSTIETSTDDRISSNISHKIFGTLKGLFVTKFARICDTDDKRMELDYVVFSDCGFPLSISTKGSHNIDTYRSNHFYSEQVFIQSKNLFLNSYFRNEHGYCEREYRSIHDDKLLNFVKDVFFDTELAQGEESAIDFEYELTLLLSSWLNAGILLPVDVSVLDGDIDKFFPFCLAPNEDDDFIDDDFIDDSEVNDEELKV
ncbi:hypothetical protein C9374_007515 [Naegleria lovaniensis]|uniref:Uncharacterized protein n=1 Tax=Naegleria lovaniensis TaxID=51637 RepID=A0AA88KIN9_NAELO|nr:uncharacterized protein C9374_007515 [Naegleria lovaniensis]KAG2379376.1 hypothetical protein C9374_007515 [Naegleria lovaniensis]